jgi:hypothetical protein
VSHEDYELGLGTFPQFLSSQFPPPLFQQYFDDEFFIAPQFVYLAAVSAPKAV